MTFHAIKRGQQRYNLDLTKGDINTIVSQIINGEAIYVCNAKGSKKKIYYAKINKVPVKVLCNWSDFKIISMFPFNADEYNMLKEQRWLDKEKDAVAFLNKLGYNIPNRFEKDDRFVENEITMNSTIKTIQCPKCGITYQTEPVKQYVECQDCGQWYYQYGRTLSTPKWIGDFIERCKGG